MSINYEIIIIGDTKPIRTEMKGKQEIAIEYNGITYKGSKSESFKNEYGLLERILFNKKDTYLLIFYEYKKIEGNKDKEPEFISPVYPPNTALRNKRLNDNRDFSFKSSNLLWRVMKYRGVKPAFRDEFKEPFSFPKIPAWALIPVVLVVLGILIYFLISTGSLDVIVKMFGGNA